MKNNPILTIIMLSFFFLANCSEEDNNPAKKTDPVITDPVTTDPVLTDKWAISFNNDIENIENNYHKNAVVVTREGDLYTGKQEIKAYYSTLKSELGEIVSMSIIRIIRVNELIKYEIGSFTTDKNEVYKHLLLYHLVNNIWVRELEIISKANETTETDIQAINETRNTWNTLVATTTDVNNFLATLYHENTIYYNQDKLPVTGEANLLESYKFVSNPSLSLVFTSIIVEPVTENLAFEIGSYLADYEYPGRYMFVWKKDGDSNWKIMLESDDEFSN